MMQLKDSISFEIHVPIQLGCNKAFTGDIGRGTGRDFQCRRVYDCRHVPEKRQWLEQFLGGMMFFLGCYLVDLLLQIRGVPEKIIPYNRSTDVDGVKANGYGMVVFDHPNGVSFAKTMFYILG